MNLQILKKINWKQPKYILPAILYFPILGASWLILDVFRTETAEMPSELQTTEYLNPTLPEARLRDDGIGGKHENMERAWGKIHDYSAVETIEQNEEPVGEQYNSRYTAEDLAMLEADAQARQAEMERIQAMQDRLERSAQAAEGMISDEALPMLTEEERLMAANQRQADALEELNAALAQARLQGRKPEEEAAELVVEGGLTIEEKETVDNAVTALSDDAESGTVVKKLVPKSDYFNTLSENDPQPNLIKAIIDENLTAVDGSRVRLRLLDDVEIDGTVVPKGTYIYATMSGFGQQRVKGSVQSMLIRDELIKVNLTLYDTDGLEGLYVPQSQFRETTKDIASGAMSNSMTLNNGSYDNSFAQWGMQSLQNAVTKTTDAISKAIKKNKAKLKYGTFVYLVNGRETRK
ncbi:MAG: conjugative transposon protein TraM [Bacteroidales bacterium]|nr:conjugative transposon protein TraM [Bacteroidales bacterium]